MTAMNWCYETSQKLILAIFHLKDLNNFGFVMFHGISTIEGYLMSDLVYTYIYISFVSNIIVGNIISKQTRAHLFTHS